jgi:hypothetical protein
MPFCFGWMLPSQQLLQSIHSEQMFALVLF